MTLGAVGVMTLDQARSKARSSLVDTERGHDPLGEKQKESRGQTVKELCAAYLERYAKVHKKSWRDDERRINKRILPARGIEAFKEAKRDRWVSPEELPRLAQAIDEEHNPYIRAALWLYLLTGVRKSELLTTRWEYVNWEHQELRLPETKAGRIHYLPLSESAIALLKQIPHLLENPYIIVGAKHGSHLVNIDKAWRRIRKAAGVEDVRLHDLRRTVGSWLAQSGKSLHLIGRVLNHSSQATTAIYARFGQDHVREALESHGKRLMGIAGKAPTAEVVEVRAKR